MLPCRRKVHKLWKSPDTAMCLPPYQEGVRKEGYDPSATAVASRDTKVQGFLNLARTQAVYAYMKERIAEESRRLVKS